jgi:hypothetical protein
MGTDMGTMPDMGAELSLSQNKDPADHQAAADLDPSAVCSRLGKVQKAILRTLRAITYNDDDVREVQKGWIQYGRVPDLAPKFGYCGNSEAAHRSSVSRSVRSLAEGKYVAAAVKEWHRFYGMDTQAGEPNSMISFGSEPWRGFDDDRTERPTPKFSYLRLTARGHKLARYLLEDDKTNN